MSSSLVLCINSLLHVFNYEDLVLLFYFFIESTLENIAKLTENVVVREH